MLAPKRALRVAPGGSAPPISFVALRGLGAARSGRESRLTDRTGKLDLGGRRPDDAVALWIEGDDADRCPVAGRPTPALRIAFPRGLVNRVAGTQNIAVLADMALRRGDIADAAVAVLVVVPVYETPPHCRAASRSANPLSGNSGRYFAVRNSASAKALSSLTRGRE